MPADPSGLFFRLITAGFVLVLVGMGLLPLPGSGLWQASGLVFVIGVVETLLSLAALVVGGVIWVGALIYKKERERLRVLLESSDLDE